MSRRYDYDNYKNYNDPYQHKPVKERESTSQKSDRVSEYIQKLETVVQFLTEENRALKKKLRLSSSDETKSLDSKYDYSYCSTTSSTKILQPKTTPPFSSSKRTVDQSVQTPPKERRIERPVRSSPFSDKYTLSSKYPPVRKSPSVKRANSEQLYMSMPSRRYEDQFHSYKKVYTPPPQEDYTLMKKHEEKKYFNREFDQENAKKLAGNNNVPLGLSTMMIWLPIYVR